ncbi:hypothetical protein BN946_scf184576.g1 [Trametes cinnabarina]|uniref:Thioesterase domain-containing protein n=1 Tax=Pycnoporus cinnabarinus TaxID=5643 RepID=A0A060SJI1_PYCCI|nr:hypothetical protein BN946_scf184576.g1 [Trametes cinnabarina]
MARPRWTSTPTPIPAQLVIKGDIPDKAQQDIVSFSDFVMTRGAFARSTGSSLVMKEIEVYRRNKDGKSQARVVYETTVHEEMLNFAGTMHGGCAAYLIDMCSSIALALLGMVTEKPWEFVSQTIITTLHAPVLPGVKIEIINNTVSFGSRTVTAVTEIWDVTNNRLCVTGTHNKMAPSAPKTKL